MSGSQGNVKFMFINGCEVAVKETKYADRSLELEAKVANIISENCPELQDFFPKLIEYRNDNQLIMSRVIGEELDAMILRVRTSNCRNLRSRSVSIIRNICKIVLCVMETVTRRTGIVHNDMHTSNVMITNTSKESFTFRFDDNKSYTIKTYGYMPVIIDFGYAHIEGELLGSLQNSDIGYTLEYKDRLADARLLLKTSFNNFDSEMKDRINKMFEGLDLHKDGYFQKLFINVYDTLYDIADVNQSCSTDAKLTNVISRIDGLNDDIVYCCDNCLLYDLEYVCLCDDFYEDKITESCQCSTNVKETFKTLLPLEPSESRKPCQQILDAAVAFKYYVILILQINKRIKQQLYTNLKVENNLDVIDCIFENIQ